MASPSKTNEAATNAGRSVNERVAVVFTENGKPKPYWGIVSEINKAGVKVVLLCNGEATEWIKAPKKIVHVADCDIWRFDEAATLAATKVYFILHELPCPNITFLILIPGQFHAKTLLVELVRGLNIREEDDQSAKRKTAAPDKTEGNQGADDATYVEGQTQDGRGVAAEGVVGPEVCL